MTIRIPLLACLLPLVVNASLLTWDRTEARVQIEPNQNQAKADYHVTNEGEETIRIEKIETSCGCTSPIIEKRILRAGESTKVTATFNKGKRRGKTHSRLSVFIEGNPQPVATLHMVIEIPELVQIQPSIIYWNKQTDQTPRTVRVRLDSRYVETITAIDYNDSTLRLTGIPSNQKQVEFELVIEPLDYHKAMRETVEIKASGPKGYIGIGKFHVLAQP
ncbi:MAG: DUF1573 domain-containing protein [Coraliomargaritaceae bacterium]